MNVTRDHIGTMQKVRDAQGGQYYGLVCWLTHGGAVLDIEQVFDAGLNKWVVLAQSETRALATPRIITPRQSPRRFPIPRVQAAQECAK